MSDIIRVVRVLEYVGPREQLERSLAQNVVKRHKQFGQITVREAYLGEFPEVLEKSNEVS